MKRPSPTTLERQCSAFNARFPVGSTVVVRRDDGSRVVTTTRTTAGVLSGHTAVLWLEGISGCYSLDRVTPLVVDAVA